MTHIVPLAGIAPAAVEDLLDRAFGADRRQRTAYRLRAGTTAIGALSFAALDAEGMLVGTLQSWPVRLDDTPLVMVGPVAVAPERQQAGTGTALMNALLEAVERIDAPPLMMIGDPDYYGRFFGFVADDTAEWEIDGPVERHRLLARLRPGQSVPDTGRIAPDRSALR